MKIAYLTRDGWTDPRTGRWNHGGTGHLRAVLPAHALRHHGHLETIVAHQFGQDQRTGEIYPMTPDDNGGWHLHAGWDVIVLISWMLAPASQPGPLGAHTAGDDIATVTNKARAYGQTVVQDVADWLWGIPTTNIGYYTTHPKYNPHEHRGHYKRALARADLITVSTPYLAERLRTLGPPVTVLTTMLDVGAYTPQAATGTTARTVGWTGSTMFRGGDLETLRGIIGPYMRRHHLTLIHGGHAPGTPAAFDVARMFGLDERTPVDRRPEVPPELYPSLFDGIDIFVAPLADRPFNLAKSACKIMEASAAGIPYIASAVRPYLEYDGGGAVARRPRDWIRHLERLDDPAERQQQATRQLERVALQDISVRWVDWRDAYLKALPSSSS